jgi:hypothetical protein
LLGRFWKLTQSETHKLIIFHEFAQEDVRNFADSKVTILDKDDGWIKRLAATSVTAT